MTYQGLLFTSTEAAALTRLSVTVVTDAIDSKIVPTTAGRENGSARLLDLRALLSLMLEHRLADRFTPAQRHALFAVLMDAPRNMGSLEGRPIDVDLRGPRRELAAALRELRRARRLVVADPDILGGEPVFRGTRVPVHPIADELARGATAAELREAYPRLTAEMLRLAPLYVAAYPPTERHRTQPWHGTAPVRRLRRKLAAIAAE